MFYRPLIRRLVSHARHRNGVAGTPFTVTLFRDGESLKLGVLFDTPGHCAVFDVAKLADGDIAFGSISYRGDHYEAGLRPLLDERHDPP